MEKGLSQKEASTLSGIAQSTLSSYEVGRIAPALGNLQKLCKLYDKTLIDATQAMDLTVDSHN